MIEAILVLATVCAFQALCLPALLWWAFTMRETVAALRADHNALDDVVVAMNRRLGVEEAKQ